MDNWEFTVLTNFIKICETGLEIKHVDRQIHMTSHISIHIMQRINKNIFLCRNKETVYILMHKAIHTG
jgi:hypothetical protein